MCHHPKRFSEDCVDFNMHEEKEIKESEEPDKSLDEAAEKKYPVYWKDYPKDGIARSELSYDTNKQCREAFIAGAEWQYQKDRGEFAKIKAKTWCEGFDAHKKQKEQKPAEWSEEDEEMLNSCISSIEESKENRYAYKETDGDTSYDYEIAWLKSLRPSWKPSEHQMSMLLAVINDPNNAGSESCHLSFKSLYNDLKKL